jgi:hypothetical protein
MRKIVLFFTLLLSTPLFAAIPVQDLQITEKGIGPIQSTMQYGAIKKALQPDYQLKVDKNFMVDLEAVEVSQKNEPLFYLVFAPGTKITDNATYHSIVVVSPKIQTKEQVGPGTTIDFAEKKYGAATLSYSVENESREFVAFEKQPAKLQFRTGTAKDAGVYSPKEGEDSYFSTNQYKAGAKIQSVIVAG